jgi:hypothetical protein
MGCRLILVFIVFTPYSFRGKSLNQAHPSGTILDGRVLSIGDFTLTGLPGNRVAATLRACSMVGACTATAKRAVPERSSTEIFAIRITSSLSPSTADGAECPTSFALIPIQTIHSNSS